MVTKLFSGEKSKQSKILVEFCLTPESKKQLQDFLKKNFRELQLSDHKAHAELKNIIRKTFPQEALEEFDRILKGESAYALLVRGCPERNIRDQIDSRHDTYSYYIGCALYEMFGAKSTNAVILKRKSHREKQSIVGRNIHRDCLRPEFQTSGEEKHSEYIIFSSPLNREHAVTQIIHLQRVVESIPENDRQRIQVMLKNKVGFTCAVTADGLLNKLKNQPSPDSFDFFYELTLPEHQDAELTHIFSEAVEKYSVKVDLQPGDLLVLNENSIFHHAYPGDECRIAKISPKAELSRFLIHNAGAPAQGR